MPQEWTVYSQEKSDFKLVYADSQKEAFIKAAELGCVASRSLDVRPRTGDAELMTQKEFEEKLLKS